MLDLAGMSWSCINPDTVAPARNGMTLLAHQAESVLVFGGITEETTPAEGKKKAKTTCVFHADCRVLTARAENVWSLCDASSPQGGRGKQAPQPRMHAAGCVIGEWAVLFGGVCEVGKGGNQEVTLDDLWAMRVNNQEDGLSATSWHQICALSDKVGEWFDSDPDSGDSSEDADEQGDDGADGEDLSMLEDQCGEDSLPACNQTSEMP